MPPKSYYASDLLGTMLGLFRVRNTTLKDNSGVLDIRNLDDTEYKSIHSESSLVEDSFNSLEVLNTDTPSVGRRKLIAKSDGWYDVDDEGVVTKVGTGAGGGMEEHGNEYHTSAFITAIDLPATYAPSSHGNEAHTSTFITSADIPASLPPDAHGNEAHTSTFITINDVPAQVQSDWNASGTVAEILNKPSTMAPTSHGNEAHSSTFITASDLPATYTPTSHGNEAHSSVFITADDIPAIPDAQIQSDWNQSNNALLDYIKNKPTTMDPTSHGNEAHSSTFITSADIPSTIDPTDHGNEAHTSTFITSADLPATYTPSSHGNEAHSSTYITSADVHSNANDPTSDEKAALGGTSGTPSATNKYVTNDDSRNTNARTPTSHGNEAHTSSFITNADLPATYTPSSHGNEAHSSAFITAADLPTTYTPSSHGNEAHTSAFITSADLPATYTPSSHGNEAHSSTFITAGDLPATYAPSSHGNEAHTSSFITLADLPASTAGDSVKKTYTQADHTFVAGNPLYVDSSGVWQLADASTATTSEALGIVESVDGNDFVLVHYGAITGSWIQSLTEGATYFVSETAGNLDTTAPTSPAIDKPILTVISNAVGSELALVRELRGIVDSDEPTLGLAEVRLVRTDTNTITLTGIAGTNKIIEVNGESVDLSSDKTIDTDSASHFIIAGTTSVSKSTALNSYAGAGSDGNNYNAYGLHHVYVCNSNACWNFDSYDRRGSIILSPQAPTVDGYLAASGDGLNARHVGWVIVNTSRLMAYATFLASRFNPIPVTARVTANTDITDLNGAANPADWRDTDAVIYAIWPEGRKLAVEVQANINNSHPDWTTLWIGISFNTTLKNTNSFYASNNALGLLIGDVRHLHYGEVATTTTVVLAKLNVGAGVLGSAADPAFWATQSYVQATIEA